MPEHVAPMPTEPGLTVGLVVGRPETPEHECLHCGVRDYAIRLAQALSDQGVAVRVIAPRSWGLSGGGAFARALRADRFDVLHLQYPSIGQRHSLLPHLLGLASAAPRFVVTLHEHSALPRVQRIANRLFRATADRLVFTTEYEARAFGAPPQSPVIPIGSNVPIHPSEPHRDDTVLYFGQIRPEKGIEDFIALATLSAIAGETTRFLLIGSAPPRWRDYCLELKARSPANLYWMEDMPLPAVASAMATGFAAYLPFPDGAGLRRGSLLAALSNGLPVIAPFGPSTTPALGQALLQADTPAAALAQLGDLRASPARGDELGAKGRAVARGFGWPAIAAEHAALYRALRGSRILDGRRLSGSKLRFLPNPAQSEGHCVCNESLDETGRAGSGALSR